MRKLSCILPLLLLLFLGLCACQGKEAPEPAAVSVDWQRLEKGTRTDQENWNRWTGVHLPYDLAAFSNAPDRVPLSDPGSLRLQDAMGVTPERATVDGVVRVWGGAGRRPAAVSNPGRRYPDYPRVYQSVGVYAVEDLARGGLLLPQSFSYPGWDGPALWVWPAEPAGAGSLAALLV